MNRMMAMPNERQKNTGFKALSEHTAGQSLEEEDGNRDRGSFRGTAQGTVHYFLRPSCHALNRLCNMEVYLNLDPRK